MIGSQNKFKIHPRVGEYYLLDKTRRKLNNGVITNVQSNWEKEFVSC